MIYSNAALKKADIWKKKKMLYSDAASDGKYKKLKKKGLVGGQPHWFPDFTPAETLSYFMELSAYKHFFPHFFSANFNA